MPQKFWEPQQDYFRKKVMGQHADVIYLKQDNELKKYVYFTLLQKCEQNLAHTLSVTDYVCQQIKTDFPTAKNGYKKSDNTGCYAGNGYLLGEYHILKEEDLTLICHDFNEPQRGKDQCDRESAVAQHCRTVYLNAAHDIQTVKDVKNSLLFMRGVKNSEVSLIEIDSSQNELKSQSIENISDYHSVDFEDNTISFWNYYQVGSGIPVDIKPVNFVSGFHVLSSFEKTNSNSSIKSSSSKKLPLDRMRNNKIFYCPTNDCIKTFLNSKILQEHISMGKHIHNLKGTDPVTQK